MAKNFEEIVSLVADKDFLEVSHIDINCSAKSAAMI